jgi:hypothetical protein
MALTIPTDHQYPNIQRTQRLKSLSVGETLITDRKNQKAFIDSLLDSISNSENSFGLIRSSDYNMIPQAILRREFEFLRERSPYDIEFQGKKVKVNQFVKSLIDKKVREIEKVIDPTKAENILKSGLLTNLLIPRRYSEQDLVGFYNEHLPVGGASITELPPRKAERSLENGRYLLEARRIISQQESKLVDPEITPVNSAADSTPEEVKLPETLEAECKKEIATPELQEHMDRFEDHYRRFCDYFGLNSDSHVLKSKINQIFKNLTRGENAEALAVIRSILDLE